MSDRIGNLHVDVAVIGAGTAGLAAYRAAKAGGATAVVIEAGEYGTTCARVGCMPSKLLLAAAEVAHDASVAAPFGLETTVRVDGAKVMDRVRSERDRFVGFVLEGVQAIAEEDKIRGRARFVGPGVLDVEGLRVEARAIVIATGSSPVVPDMLSSLGDRLVLNDDVFSWRALPASVVVFGAGVIGLELGQALSRLGVRVRVFGRGGSVGPLTDPDVREAAKAALSSELAVDFDAKVHQVRRSGDEIVVAFEDANGAREERFEYALVAAGRRPNVQKLGLAEAGIELDARGRPVFDRCTLRCGASSVFVAGDANDDVPLLHEAADEGRIAGENAAALPLVRDGFRRSPLAIVFSDPQLAIAGRSFAEIAARGGFVTGEVDFADQGRSRVMRKNRGLLHVYADVATGRLLGAELAGPRAEHLAHLLAWSHQAGLTVEQMLAMPFYHPVVEEGLRTALRDAIAKRGRALAQTPNEH